MMTMTTHRHLLRSGNCKSVLNLSYDNQRFFYCFVTRTFHGISSAIYFATLMMCIACINLVVQQCRLSTISPSNLLPASTSLSSTRKAFAIHRRSSNFLSSGIPQPIISENNTRYRLLLCLSMLNASMQSCSYFLNLSPFLLPPKAFDICGVNTKGAFSLLNPNLLRLC